MPYIIQEMQTTGDQTALVTPDVRAGWNDAISVFHQKASYAAVSSVPVHTVMVYDERGSMIEKVVFTHETE